MKWEDSCLQNIRMNPKSTTHLFEGAHFKTKSIKNATSYNNCALSLHIHSKMAPPQVRSLVVPILSYVHMFLYAYMLEVKSNYITTMSMAIHLSNGHDQWI